MQQLVINVIRSRRFTSGDGFHVYGNGGSGAIDWDHPITSRRYLFRPDAPPAAAHLLAAHLHPVHLDSVTGDGHQEGTHLLDEHLRPASAVTFVTRSMVFGRFLHAVVVEDSVGNTDLQQAVIHEQVINAAPPPPSDFKAIHWDEITGRLSFAFTPSDRLVG